MKLKIFTIHDMKADLHGPPFYMNTNGEALRAFADLANDQSSTVSKHPGDFQLMCIGTWDNQEGTIIQDHTEKLGFASDYKAAGNVTPIGVAK